MPFCMAISGCTGVRTLAALTRCHQTPSGSRPRSTASGRTLVRSSPRSCSVNCPLRCRRRPPTTPTCVELGWPRLSPGQFITITTGSTSERTFCTPHGRAAPGRCVSAGTLTLRRSCLTTPKGRRSKRVTRTRSGLTSHSSLWSPEPGIPKQLVGGSRL